MGGRLEVLTHGPEATPWKRLQRRPHLDRLAVGIGQHQRGKRLLQGVGRRAVLHAKRFLWNVLYIESIPGSRLRLTHEHLATLGLLTHHTHDGVYIYEYIL